MDKEYHKNYSKEWYNKDRENKIEQRKERRNTVRIQNLNYLKEIKESNPCTDCGEYYPFYVMHFDHLPGTLKRSNISSMQSWSKKSLAEEIEKCELVCANCHASRTYNRL